MIDPAAAVDTVARSLLGAKVRTRIDGALTEVILTEVEAYGGADDPASHAYRGRTERNASMFAEAGTLYVYRSYGIHWCANVVSGPAGRGEAVLLRGGLPNQGRAVMEARRGRSGSLTDGPGKLCQALGLDGTHDGLTPSAGSGVELLPAVDPPTEVIATPRIGISRETERLWRFVAEL